MHKHSSRPSQGGEEWENSNWFNLENVINRICSLQHDSKFRLNKNKNILSSVLGACLVAAIEVHSKRGSKENTIIDSLQNLVEILQKQLDEGRNEINLLWGENHSLQIALRQEQTKNIKKNETPTETEEKEVLLNYSKKYGPIRVLEEKAEKTKGVRHIVSPSDKPEKGKQNPSRQYWWSLGLKKQILKDVMDGLPLHKHPITKDLLITAIVCLKRAPVTFVVDTGAKISVLTRKASQKCGIVPTKRKCLVLNTLGNQEDMDIVLIKILLPGEENLLLIKIAIGDIPNDLLGMDVLAGRQWEDEDGCLWSFGNPCFNINLLQTAPSLPFSKITN
ncbi:hypothetical protein Nmel_018945, partial [Mimus melanotis]